MQSNGQVGAKWGEDLTVVLALSYRNGTRSWRSSLDNVRTPLYDEVT